ncbi:MAG: hypothetical protein EPN60_18600 [Nevskiaceae bacterium]|nr:MAG: hypothetical protein EPO48_07275 [Nevskiaceae bacterium]TAM21347.1 MAG: hypothetical protein EPN60_18600 [Nevskiaceae bacterium]
MIRSRLSRSLDYVPPVVAFIAALVAVVGAPKWNEAAIGLSKVTLVGWVVVGIGAVALMTSLLVTKRNHASQASQQALRNEIALIGQDQLLRGVERIVCVFKESRLWHEGHPEPLSPADLLATDRRAALSRLNLNARSPYYDGKEYPKWWEMFENTARQGSEQLTTGLQIYVTFLAPEIIEATTKLLNCEFMHRLHHVQSIIDANTKDNPERSVTFFWVAPDEHHRCGYEEFWSLVAKVMGLCAGHHQAEWQTS